MKRTVLISSAIIGMALAGLVYNASIQPAQGQFLYQANDQANGPVTSDPLSSGLFTNSFTNFAATNEVTTETARIPIRQGKGVTLFPWIKGNATTCTNGVGIYFDPATDGTAGKVPTTTHPFTKTVSANSTNDVIDAYTIYPSNLIGIDWLYITGGTNKNTNSVAFKGCRWSYPK